MLEVFKEFRFEAAHRLVNVPTGHQCYRMHGHSYLVRVVCEGETDPELGWVIDYADIARVWKPLELRLDHHFLNEIPGLEISTSENLAKWIFWKMKAGLPCLARVEVRETPAAGAIYRP